MLTENQKMRGMIHSHFDPENLNLGNHVVVGGGRNVTKETNRHVMRDARVHLQ